MLRRTTKASLSKNKYKAGRCRKEATSSRKTREKKGNKMLQDPRTMDIINPELRGMPVRDYHQELNIRSHRAGHTTREGGPKSLKIQNRGYGKSKLNLWPRDKNGVLIGD